MTQSRTRFAWIIDEVNDLRILAVSDLLCDLLQLGRDEIVGTCIIDDPVFGRLEQVCANFGVATLIECMLVRTLQLRSGLDPESAFGQTVHRFFDRARRHVEANEKRIASQIGAAPIETSGRPYRPVLEQCLRAVREEPGVSWPEYSFGGLDYMPLEFGKHPLLPPRKTARFIKSGTPIPSNAPTACLVLLQPDPHDHVAQKLQQAILSRLR